MSDQAPVIVWFRDDLRIADNPALLAASATGRPMVCLFVRDEESKGIRPLGGAAKWWLGESLQTLANDLQELGGKLVLRTGKAASVVPDIAQETGAVGVCWNRRYGAAAQVDEKVEAALQNSGIVADSFQANLLFEPGVAGKTLRVFTPFWKRMRSLDAPRKPHPRPKKLTQMRAVQSESLSQWQLKPHKPDWAGGLREAWTPGEAGAQAALEHFIDDVLDGYGANRDRPDRDGTSRLSPHLRFGEISPFQVWHAVMSARGDAPSSDIEKFLAELGWREFNYQLLHDAPDIAERNLQPRFDGFGWDSDKAAVQAWQQGCTGYPIVDAAMRDLWSTGFMHNRLRMVVASFLVKHLLIDWRVGEQWFWGTLVDADFANNPANWQWVAGAGADAAPYFRIFNPILQGEKFDPHGDFVRRFVPELADVPDRYVHQPWKLSPVELASAGVKLGDTYPEPIIDHDFARRRALAAYDKVKG